MGGKLVLCRQGRCNKFTPFYDPKPYTVIEVHRSRSSFSDWLEAGEWERAGSASFGQIEYRVSTPDGERVGKFKARKNLVMDVASFEDLHTRVMTYDKQDNKALIKSELGKIRIAVASPLETYLQMSWLYVLGGSFYLTWLGNTLEENLIKEASRNEVGFLRLREGSFALPYDFAAFDHQPTKLEITTFQDVIDGVGIAAATAEQRPTAQHLHELIQHGHDVAVLHAPAGQGSSDIFPVTGGLMSGLRTTSSVGSGWNSVLGTMAFDILGRLARRDVRNESLFEIRGDDTQL